MKYYSQQPEVLACQGGGETMRAFVRVGKVVGSLTTDSFRWHEKNEILLLTFGFEGNYPRMDANGRGFSLGEVCDKQDLTRFDEILGGLDER